MNWDPQAPARKLSALLSAPEPLRVLALGSAAWLLTARVGVDFLGASGLWREDAQDPARALALSLGLAVASFVVLLVGAARLVSAPDRIAAVLTAFAAFALPVVLALAAGGLLGGAVLAMQAALAIVLASAIALLVRRGLARHRGVAAPRTLPAQRWRLAKILSPGS